MRSIRTTEPAWKIKRIRISFHEYINIRQLLTLFQGTRGGGNEKGGSIHWQPSAGVREPSAMESGNGQGSQNEVRNTDETFGHATHAPRHRRGGVRVGGRRGRGGLRQQCRQRAGHARFLPVQGRGRGLVQAGGTGVREREPRHSHQHQQLGECADRPAHAFREGPRARRDYLQRRLQLRHLRRLRGVP